MRSPGGSVFPLAVLLLAACEDQPRTAFAPDAEELSPDLALIAPAEMPERRRVVRERFEMEDAPTSDGTRPALSEHLGYGSYPGYEYELPPDAAAGIFDARTDIWFLPGRLSVVGRHEFTGNKGSVETKANLAFQGTTIGTDLSYSEKGYPFLWPPWDVHFIFTEARIYTDRECGHDGWGDSLHKAWWEAVLGGPVFTFNAVARSTISDRIFQPPCPPSPPSPGGTMNPGGSTTGGGGEGLCYLWITYDLYTGQIYDQQIIFCTDGG